MHGSSQPSGHQSIIAMLRRTSAAITVIFWLWVLGTVALADSQKSKTEDAFVNPLESTIPDPLLPQQNRPLTSLQRLKLKAALDQLNQQAAARLATGDRVNAFAIWNRELRLRRYLGFQEEVEALGRVGAIAWSENQRLEVQVITSRLQAIQQQAQSQPRVNLRLLRSLGAAYQQVREPRLAIAVYERILATARQQKNAALVEATLKTIADLHLSWFNYPSAATTYEELLGLATAKGDRLGVVTNLQQLAYIYEKAKQYQQSVALRQKLAEIYQNQQQYNLLPALQLANGSDYQALGKLREAFENYQEAYASAWSLQQYSLASDALRRLVALYRSQGQIDAALQTSQILLEADRLGSNVYGMMTTYDQIGQIYLNRRNYGEALAAFQKGFELSQQLRYQETYFAQQIQQINQRLSR